MKTTLIALITTLTITLSYSQQNKRPYLRIFQTMEENHIVVIGKLVPNLSCYFFAERDTIDNIPFESTLSHDFSEDLDCSGYYCTIQSMLFETDNSIWCEKQILKMGLSKVGKEYIKTNEHGIIKGVLEPWYDRTTKRTYMTFDITWSEYNSNN